MYLRSSTGKAKDVPRSRITKNFFEFILIQRSSYKNLNLLDVLDLLLLMLLI